MRFSDTPVLNGRAVSLQPLSVNHAVDLEQASAAGDLYKTWYTMIPSPGEVQAEIERRLALQHAGSMAPWAITLTTDGVAGARGQAIGMTTFMRIDEPNKSLEIGSTWMARSAQGTGINTEMKLLMLARAFDELKCNRVEFRTHWHNQQSRRAIAGLGAKQDGVLRSDQVWRDGTLRDTVVFSILAHEWPAARSGLEAKLDRRTPSPSKSSGQER